MIPFTPDRVGDYLRALHAGLRVVGLTRDHPSLDEARRVLTVLDPAISADLFAPAAVSRVSGMPEASWWSRPLAERRSVASALSPEVLERARLADPALGSRMTARAEVRRLLAEGPVMEPGRVHAVLRRPGPPAEVVLSSDRIAPDDRWVRIRFDAATQGGAVEVRGGQVVLDPGVATLVDRSWALDLGALAELLADSLSVRVLRLARGAIGPAWFPGIEPPFGVPLVLCSGFVLHAAVEVWEAGSSPRCWQERRLAASATVIEDVRAWSLATGVRSPLTLL